MPQKIDKKKLPVKCGSLDVCLMPYALCLMITCRSSRASDQSVRTRLTSPSHVSIRQHTSAYVRIRQHTSAYVNIRELRYSPDQAESCGVGSCASDRNASSLLYSSGGGILFPSASLEIFIREHMTESRRQSLNNTVLPASNPPASKHGNSRGGVWLYRSCTINSSSSTAGMGFSSTPGRR